MTRASLALVSILSALLFQSAYAFAQGGSGVKGGDDCERRFKEVRDDIEGWLDRGGQAELKLPEGLSVGDYTTRMLSFISGSSKAHIKCVGPGDVGYPIGVEGAPKTCKNFVDPREGAQIVCDRLKLDQTSEEGQYRLVHHEYAGLADIEVGYNDESDYRISDQLSLYLEYIIVRRLPLKPRSPLPPFRNGLYSPVTLSAYLCGVMFERSEDGSTLTYGETSNPAFSGGANAADCRNGRRGVLRRITDFSYVDENFSNPVTLVDEESVRFNGVKYRSWNGSF